MSTSRVMVGAALLAVAAASASAQTTTRYNPPRIGGHPDLNGIWQTLSDANYDLEMHMARPALQTRQGPYGPVPAKDVLPMGAVAAVPPSMGVIVGGGPIPYLPDALKKKQENQADWIHRDPEVKCYLPGVPRATYLPYPFQIFQNGEDIFVAYEYAGAVRDIYLKDPGPAPVDSWMGQSVGHWEGDTLVVDVKGFNDQSWLDRAGDWHSDQLHVVERYTRTSPDVISYEATIEDPAVYSRSWRIAMPLYRRQEANVQLMDFKCVEFVEELLYGKFRKKPLDP